MARADPDLTQRFMDFELEIYRAASERVADHDWGAAILNPSLPLVWDASLVVITKPGIDATEVAEIAGEVLDGAGMSHRTVLSGSDGVGRDLAPGLERLGWEIERAIYMVWSGEPDHEPNATASEVRHAEIEDLRSRLIRSDLPMATPQKRETVEQLLEWDRRVGTAAGDRWFVADDDHGNHASTCRLLVREGRSLGQVEDVGTLLEARERGLARAVTLTAARASVANGHEVTFLGALADDWPQVMYARLGFTEVGSNWTFRRPPPGR